MVVRLDRPRPGSVTEAQANSHPIDFAEQDLAVLLRSVAVQKALDFFRYYFLRQDPKPERAFLDEDVAMLAPHLRTGLAAARPEESVVFVLSRARGEGVSEVTSGAVFVRGERLCVLLANWRVPVTTSRKMHRARERPLVSLGEPDFTIVPGPHHTVLGPQDPGFPAWAAGAKGVTVAYRPMLAASPGPPGPSGAQTPATQPPSAAAPPSSLDAKLRQLKVWKEQGLITEQEHQEQKRKLLESF